MTDPSKAELAARLAKVDALGVELARQCDGFGELLKILAGTDLPAFLTPPSVRVRAGEPTVMEVQAVDRQHLEVWRAACGLGELVLSEDEPIVDGDRRWRPLEASRFLGLKPRAVRLVVWTAEDEPDEREAPAS